MNDCLSFLPQSTFHILAKIGIQAEQTPNQKLKYDFQKAVAGVISGASYVFTKLSYTCTGWDFIRMDKKEPLGKEQLPGNYKHNNYWSLHRRLVLNNLSQETWRNTQSIQLRPHKQS